MFLRNILSSTLCALCLTAPIAQADTLSFAPAPGLWTQELFINALAEPDDAPSAAVSRLGDMVGEWGLRHVRDTDDTLLLAATHGMQHMPITISHLGALNFDFGCNYVSGQVDRPSDTAFNVSSMFSTLMACLDGADLRQPAPSMDVEDAVARAFSTATRVTVTDQSMTLLDDDGRTLAVFDRL